MRRVRINTFHGFFWWLVESYSRYGPSGSTERPWLLGKKLIGLEFVPDGYRGYTFEAIEQSALRLLQIASIRYLISDLYPLLVIDEFQDVDDTLFDIIALLADKSKLVLLLGPGQCIYRGMKKFDPKEVLRKCREHLHPVKFEIPPAAPEKQRHSPQIAQLISEYENGVVSLSKEWPIKFAAIPRLSIKGILSVWAGLAQQYMRPYLREILSRENRITIAILASTNQAVAEIQKRIEKGYEHLTIANRSHRLHPRQACLLYGDRILLHYGRLLLQLLQGHWIAKKQEPVNERNVAVAIACLFEEADGDVDETANSWLPLAQDLIRKVRGFRQPKLPDSRRSSLRKHLKQVNKRLRAAKNSKTNRLPEGCPSTPFSGSDIPLLDSLSKDFQDSIESAFDGKLWLDIKKARWAFEKSTQQRIIFEKLGLQKSVQVMTIHKAKGREFDGVVLVLEDNGKQLWTNSDDNEAVEDLYRVAISRARSAFALVAFKDAYQKAAPAVKRLLPEGLFARAEESTGYSVPKSK
jgi:DNA helicase-2/ATP-dependent DNA helicase PcrA